MWSFATTPGNRLVTPRISSAGGRAFAWVTTIAPQLGDAYEDEAGLPRVGRPARILPIQGLALTYAGGRPFLLSHAPNGVSTQALMLPSLRPLMAASIFAWMAGVIMLALSWKGDRPTESVVMSRLIVPPLSVLAFTRWIASETALVRFFSALTTVHLAVSGVERNWSTSTPMALILWSHADWRTPLPFLPATWNRTSMSGFWLSS